jgi:peptidyl-tRNA hydrolase, PTH1 family
VAADQDGIRLIVGLGNPGAQYEATRHNAGFWLVDRIAERHHGQFRNDGKFYGALCRIDLHGADIRLLKPTTFMNHSGQSVAAVARYFDIPYQQILVAYDELDLPPGRVRLKRGGGHAGHNGMRHTITSLGSSDFWRLRIGIGHPGSKYQVVSYVLGRASSDDEAAINRGIDDVDPVLPFLVSGDYQLAMNRLHGSN